MARKSNYRFEKRRKEEARQKRKAEKRDSKRNKREDAGQGADNLDQRAPVEEPSAAPPRPA